MDYDEDDFDLDYDDEEVELPGVESDSDEEQNWEAVDAKEIIDLLEDSEQDSVQANPEPPQVDDEDVEQQEADEPIVETVLDDEEDDDELSVEDEFNGNYGGRRRQFEIEEEVRQVVEEQEGLVLDTKCEYGLKKDFWPKRKHMKQFC